MGDKTAIEWTDATWNPITGCSVVSPGCKHCYAMRLAGTRLQHHRSRTGLTDDTKAGPVWNGKVRLNKEWLHQPSTWKKPRRIFVCAHGDLFHENVPYEWILDVFTVMAAHDHHTYQVLTKRPDRMRTFLSQRDRLEDIYNNWSGFSGRPREVQSWPLHNVWLGTSVEDQARADERVPLLLETPAAVRFVSAEPLLGPLDLGIIRGGQMHPRISWVIVGGESGPDARPMHPDWARSLRDQCTATGVPFFFKQWGEWMPVDEWSPGPPFAREIAIMPDGSEVPHDVVPQDVGGHRVRLVGKKRAGRLLDGIEHTAWPEVSAP